LSLVAERACLNGAVLVRWKIVTDEIVAEQSVETPPEIGPAVSIESRFLFVDVAALRAKQLRRGALSRLPDQADGHETPKKAERIAMEEVRRGLVRPMAHAVKPQGTKGKS
jgi:DNA-directed RNA polymerase subunit K/omega